MTPRFAHLKDLTPDPANRRQHTPRNLGMLVDALQKVGASRSIVVDEDGVILAGNGVVEAASEAGITKLQIVEADGETIVAVRRRGLTPAQKRELALYDNRTAELAEWNLEQLAADLTNGEDLSAFFYDDELKTLLAGPEGVKAGLTDPDAVPQERPTSIVAGDLFELGPHRLLCGDSTSGDAVARLMGGDTAVMCLTDPPYGVDYAERNMARDGNAAVTMAYHEGRNADPLAALRFVPPVVIMSYPIDRHFFALADRLRECDLEFRRELVWVKSRPLIVLGSYYNQQHEPILILAKRGHPLNAQTKMMLSTVFSTEKATAHAEHPTAKPIELWTALLENHSTCDDLVYEPFAGSGTTIISCEQLARKCRAIEIEPGYCQVIIDRWEAFTGQKAVKV
jgi:DNA modification methylase